VPGDKWKRSLKNPAQYESIKADLLEDGLPLKEAKTRAARISNARPGPGHSTPSTPGARARRPGKRS
jgi:hypothetical protein